VVAVVRARSGVPELHLLAAMVVQAQQVVFLVQVLPMQAVVGVVVVIPQQRPATVVMVVAVQEGLLPLASLEPQTLGAVAGVVDLMELIILVATVARVS
jgi:hypothetical protein